MVTPHSEISRGAVTAKLLMSANSKKYANDTATRVDLWKREIGSLSSRLAAFEFCPDVDIGISTPSSSCPTVTTAPKIVNNRGVSSTGNLDDTVPAGELFEAIPETIECSAATRSLGHPITVGVPGGEPASIGVDLVVDELEVFFYLSELGDHVDPVGLHEG